MTTKSELSAANRALMADDRRRLGEPPTAEEVLAYSRGELSPEEAARIRERLIAYPELVRTLTAPFPEGAEPGDADYLSEHELARHWAALQKRRQRPEGARVLQFWRAFGAIAAALAIVFGVMFWRAQTELRKPRLLTYELVQPDGQRGAGDPSTELTATGEMLLVPYLGDSSYKSYRAEILNAAVPPRIVWDSGLVPSGPNGSVTILIRRDSLKLGKYKLAIYGIPSARQEPLSTYTLRVPAR